MMIAPSLAPLALRAHLASRHAGPACSPTWSDAPAPRQLLHPVPVRLPALGLPGLRALHLDVHSDCILPEIVDADAAPGLSCSRLRTLRLCMYGRGAKPEAGAVAALVR